jgi:hypothetical protein
MAVTGPAAYRTELSRSSGGQWTLYQGGVFTARTGRQDLGPRGAREWACAVLHRSGMEWLNGRWEPDAESGYWVADPEEPPAGAS